MFVVGPVCVREAAVFVVVLVCVRHLCVCNGTYSDTCVCEATVFIVVPV